MGSPMPMNTMFLGATPTMCRAANHCPTISEAVSDRISPICAVSQNVQPIFTSRCAITSCHTGPPQQASGGQSLDAAVAYAQSVNAPATTGKLLRVKPGSIRASQLAHRILGQGLPRGGAVMPQGCPGFPPAGGCLTTEEIFTILSWIAAGAPDN